MIDLQYQILKPISTVVILVFYRKREREGGREGGREGERERERGREGGTEREREREREGEGTWKEKVTNKWFRYFSLGPECGHSSLVRSQKYF